MSHRVNLPPFVRWRLELSRDDPAKRGIAFRCPGCRTWVTDEELLDDLEWPGQAMRCPECDVEFA